MKADTRTLQDLFHGDRRFVVPVYQRPYVWELEKQWEPLWTDLEATATRLGEARIQAHAKGVEASAADQSAPPHFLGAIVIEDRAVLTGDVDVRLVVDGQQRLTTLQLLFRGVLDALDALDAVSVDGRVRARVRKAIENDREVVRADEVMKVTPRQSEQSDYLAAMGSSAPQPHESRFAAARDFFRAAAASFLADEKVPMDPYATGSGSAARAALLDATILGLMKVVVIDLEEVDDAQVIFEALNARNTPLTATDLVKNLLFMKIQADAREDPQQVYDSLWRRFDDDSGWWLEWVGVGHAQRARQDWLLGDWLIAQLGRTISVGRLYGEFRRWLQESSTPPLQALSTLNQYADAYEALNGRRYGASPRELEAFRRIETLNITVAMPVLLWLFVQSEERLPRGERERAVLAIESFVIRRMATKYQTRAYGQVFVEVLKAAHQGTDPAQAIITALAGEPHGYNWPTFAEIRSTFEAGRFYGPGGINQERLRMLLGEIDRLLQRQAKKAESVSIKYGGLQVEHVIPREWREYWPVTALDHNELLVKQQHRDQHVNRIGNLTLANGHLNPAMGNSPWAAKRDELHKHSKLELNARLVEHDEWDEERIVARGRWLAERFEEVWPGPESARWAPPAKRVLPTMAPGG